MNLGQEMLKIGLFGGRIALSELILFGIFLTDILMLGLLDETSLAAALLVNSSFTLFFVTALGFLQGALPTAAGHWERGDKAAFDHSVTSSLIMAGLIGVAVMLVFLAYIPLLGWLGFPETLRSEAWRYLIGILPGYGMAMVYIAVRNGVIATANSKGFMTISIIGLGLNAALNQLLGFGLEWGSYTTPALGIAGIGLASSLIEIFLLVGFSVLLWRRSFRPLFSAGTGMRDTIGQLSRLGAPIAVIFFVDTTLFSVVLVIVGRHDVQGMAALALVFEWVALAVMVPVGLSEAIVQRVSAVRVGSNRQERLSVLIRATFLLMALYLAVVALIQFGFGINMPALFILDGDSHPALLDKLNAYALLGFLVGVSYSFVIILAGILRGLLDLKASMFAVVICNWGIGIGLTFILVEWLGYGSQEALAVIVLATALACLSISLQLFRVVRRQV